MSNPPREEIATADGQKLVAHFFKPDGEPKGAVLIIPAMGVAQHFYFPLAEWLAREQFLVGTFDYRGTGLSSSQNLKEFKADIFDWARLDCGAMIDAIVARAPGRPLFWIGHSLGGQILPFVPNRYRITKAITIAAGSGYWRENSRPLRRYVWWLWYVVVPLALRIFGYFPGKRLRMVGDLPKGVMEQWRKWCLSPVYALVEGEDVRQQYADVTTPIVSLSFSDDEMMSARNTESLLGFYTRAPKLMKRISPRDIDVQRIGHFGFFRPTFQQSLWRGYLLPELAAAED